MLGKASSEVMLILLTEGGGGPESYYYGLFSYSMIGTDINIINDKCFTSQCFKSGKLYKFSILLSLRHPLIFHPFQI